MGTYGKTVLMAGLIAIVIAVFLFYEFPKDAVQQPVSEFAPKPIRIAQNKSSPNKPPKPVKHVEKKMPKKVVKQKPVKVEPYVTRSEDLILTFPEPTPITIKIADKPSYVKLSSNQQELDESAPNWNCVVDKNTGLTWEKKTEDRGLRDAENFYSWYNPDIIGNGGYAGVADNGKCRGGIDCDTNAYVEAVNELKLCGYSDWRLPTRAELMTLVQFSGNKIGKGLIDAHYFPGAASDWYWASDSDVDNSKYAWYVLYFNGRYMRANKAEAKRVRLVRSSNERSMHNMAQGPTTDAANPAKTAKNIPVNTNPSGS